MERNAHALSFALRNPKKVILACIEKRTARFEGNCLGTYQPSQSSKFVSLHSIKAENPPTLKTTISLMPAPYRVVSNG